MVIIWGVRLVGKVDAVPRIGHVATRFFHLYYVPLIPLGTFLVTSEDDEAPGPPLPLSAKSILAAWLRTAAWLVLAAGSFAAITGGIRHDPGRVALGVAALVVASIALWALYRLNFLACASYERAMEIADLCGFAAEQRLLLEVAYGRMNAEQAEKALLSHFEMSPQGNP